MRLYAGKISLIASEVIHELLKTQDIDVVSEAEARLDVEAVLKEQLRIDKQVSDEAKNRMDSRGLGYENLGRTRAQVSKERGIATGDEFLPYLVGQILNMLFHSQNIDEVYAEDAVLRKKITAILRSHTEVETELDQEVRAKIKNLEEGTASFDIEYARVMDQIKRQRGLT